MSETARHDHSAHRWTLDDFHSADASMQRCLELARIAARTDLPVLIQGESGTGKTLLAEAIHNSSKRAAGPFVSFNAAALSETLLDSQLFGHERGAFTGADRAMKGKFELADGGTLFLDEIADMSPMAQAKILRASEYGEFERLGSERLQVADARLISATHFPLRQFAEAERFRRDLFYRLSGLIITVPPLRDRPNDLRSLVGAQIVKASQKERRNITGLDQAAAEQIFSHSWPGNLRELARVIHLAVALSPDDIIPEEAILLNAGEVLVADDPLPAAVLRPHTTPMDDATDLTLVANERRHIAAVLERVGGNKRRAAKALGISRSRLDRKL